MSEVGMKGKERLILRARRANYKKYSPQQIDVTNAIHRIKNAVAAPDQRVIRNRIQTQIAEIGKRIT